MSVSKMIEKATVAIFAALALAGCVVATEADGGPQSTSEKTAQTAKVDVAEERSSVAPTESENAIPTRVERTEEMSRVTTSETEAPEQDTDIIAPESSSGGGGGSGSSGGKAQPQPQPWLRHPELTPHVLPRGHVVVLLQPDVPK